MQHSSKLPIQVTRIITREPSLNHWVFAFIVPAVAALTLSACSIQIEAPAAAAVITVPSPTSTTKVTVTGNWNYTDLKVTVDGTDFTNQMHYTGGNNYDGNLSLAAGKHTVVASAQVNCLYCSGQKFLSTDPKTFCVAVSGAPSMTKTTFAKRDQLSWASLSNQNLSFAPDSGTSSSRWNFRNLAGAANEVGMIESIQFPCLCARSPDDTANSPITLALCDTSDVRQRCTAFGWSFPATKGFISSKMSRTAPA
jgi:hypothetical protein